MKFVEENYKGISLAILIALPAFLVGKLFPIIGGPIIAILIGMILNPIIKEKKIFENGIRFTSKKILQYAVILLGFGLNLNIVLETGKQSFPIIVSTISISLLIAFVLSKIFKIDTKIATLIGVGSSVCGGSAIAAATPVINANDDEVATALSVIFFFNVLAAIIFPQLGVLLNFDPTSGNAFGIFAGTAINDTSSVTAAASTWDSMFNLSSQTLDKAVTVKLTRTLAIIPITLVLAFMQSKKEKTNEKHDWKKIFPLFIIYFIIASLITTIVTNFGVDNSIFDPFKAISKFFIIMAMGAIGFNTNLVKLVTQGGKPILLGFSCWIGITIVSLAFQSILNIW
jgi:uncharacterized integral membrane protein (TIGR00698 family)